jgi:hypothetical protein
MSDYIIKTIEQARVEIEAAEKVVRPKKILVNQLCEMAGIPPIYPGIDESPTGSARLSIRRNAFYGRPLSTCLREILEMRASLPVREASLEGIIDDLKEGGYDLKASGESGVAIALGKNSQTFHRVASGDWGLISWYPNIKEKKAKIGDVPKDDTSSGKSPLPGTPTTPEPSAPASAAPDPEGFE